MWTIDRAQSEQLFKNGLDYGNLLLKIAQSQEEKNAAFRLRYKIFNEELGEGIPENATTQMDTDDFDSKCDHLLLIDDNEIVGTYRLINGKDHAQTGFYSETQFHIRNIGINYEKAVEIGRGCIDPQKRKKSSLLTLFCGFYHYLNYHEQRYLFGCASLPIMNDQDAEATYQAVLNMGKVDQSKDLSTLEKNFFPPQKNLGTPNIPPLLSVYLEFGAKVIGRPAFDPIFGCHDLFTLLDAEELTDWGKALLTKFNKRIDARKKESF